MDALQPVRSQAHTPLFQVTFAYEYIEDATFELPDLRVSAVEFDVTPAQFDLALTLFETTEYTSGADTESVAVSGSLTYATDLFDRSTAASFADRFVMMLEQLTRDPARVIGDIDVLNRDEQNLLVPVRGLTAAASRDSVRADFCCGLVESNGDRLPVEWPRRHLYRGRRTLDPASLTSCCDATSHRKHLLRWLFHDRSNPPSQSGRLPRRVPHICRSTRVIRPIASTTFSKILERGWV